MAEHVLYDDEGNQYTVEADTAQEAASMLSSHLSKQAKKAPPVSLTEPAAQPQQSSTPEPTQEQPSRLRMPLPGVLGSAAKLIGDTFPTATRIAGQGIPIAGRYIEDTPETKQFKQDHPTGSKVLQTGGAIASAIPVGIAASAAAPISAPTLGAMGLNALFNGGISAVDSYLGGNSGGDIAKDATLSALFSAGGTAAGKALSQAPSAVEKAYAAALANQADRVAKAGSGTLGGYKPLPYNLTQPANLNAPVNPVPSPQHEVMSALNTGLKFGVPLELAQSILGSNPITGKYLLGTIAGHQAYKKLIEPMAKNNSLFSPFGKLGPVPPAVGAGVAGAAERDQFPFIYGSGNAE